MLWKGTDYQCITKSEQCLAASLKLVIEKAEAQLSNSHNEYSTYNRSRGLHVGHCKNATLTQKWFDDLKPWDCDEVPKKAEVAEQYIPMVWQASPILKKTSKNISSFKGRNDTVLVHPQANQLAHSFQHYWYSLL